MVAKSEALMKLAARCSDWDRPHEDKREPLHTIDEDIHLALGEDDNARFRRRYTTSLDAAVLLIPRNHDWIIEYVNGGLTIGARVGHNDPDRTSWGGSAALALCAAALKARAALCG